MTCNTPPELLLYFIPFISNHTSHHVYSFFVELWNTNTNPFKAKVSIIGLTYQTKCRSIMFCDEILLHVFLSSYQGELHGVRWSDTLWVRLISISVCTLFSLSNCLLHINNFYFCLQKFYVLWMKFLGSINPKTPEIKKLCNTELIFSSRVSCIQLCSFGSCRGLLISYIHDFHEIVLIGIRTSSHLPLTVLAVWSTIQLIVSGNVLT